MIYWVDYKIFYAEFQKLLKEGYNFDTALSILREKYQNKKDKGKDYHYE